MEKVKRGESYGAKIFIKVPAGRHETVRLYIRAGGDRSAGFERLLI